jgi:hypothetical protein
VRYVAANPTTTRPEPDHPPRSAPRARSTVQRAVERRHEKERVASTGAGSMIEHGPDETPCLPNYTEDPDGTLHLLEDGGSDLEQPCDIDSTVVNIHHAMTLRACLCGLMPSTDPC